MLFKLLVTVFFVNFCILNQSVYAQSQAQMNAEAGADFQKADAKLNKTYKALYNSLNGTNKSSLKEAQRAWLKYTELHMKFLFPLKKGEDPRSRYGSIYPMDVALEKVELWQTRIKQLEAGSFGG